MNVITACVVAALLSGSPADALELAPGPPPSPQPVSPTAPLQAPLPSEAGGSPAGNAALGIVLAAVSGVQLGRRRDDDADDTIPDPVVLLVTGHGNGEGDFDELTSQMDLPGATFERFDWRSTRLDTSFENASEHASVEEAAGALHAHLNGLAALGRPIYLVGFSKGGATIAELISWWDQDPSLRVADVYGAALLDPPIADGFKGWMQRIGYWVGPIPDNGGFEAHRCDRLGCRDIRDHLGRESQIETIIIRNPDAWLTNARSGISGVRMYDLEDDGGDHAVKEFLGGGQYDGHPLSEIVGAIVAGGRRIAEAHNSVLEHPEVAECLVAEIRHPGGCDETWDGGSSRSMYSAWISGGGGTPRL